MTIAGSASLYARVSYEVASGTNGGTATSGSWEKRTVNTEVDTDNIVSVSASQLTLLAGTYDCLIVAALVNCNGGQVRLQNVTDTTTVALGQNVYMSGVSGNNYWSPVCQRFTVGSSKALEIQTGVAVTVADFGMGYPNSFGVSEVYTIAEFWKVS